MKETEADAATRIAKRGDSAVVRLCECCAECVAIDLELQRAAMVLRSLEAVRWILSGRDNTKLLAAWSECWAEYESHMADLEAAQSATTYFADIVAGKLLEGIQ